MKDKELPITGFEPKGNQFGLKDLAMTEPRYLMLNGYRSAIADVPLYGVKKGWQCINCGSMVYLNKCPNDACYNFQILTSYRYNLEGRIWEMLVM